MGIRGASKAAASLGEVWVGFRESNTAAFTEGGVVDCSTPNTTASGEDVRVESWRSTPLLREGDVRVNVESVVAV
jgi:hypothetical protein